MKKKNITEMIFFFFISVMKVYMILFQKWTNAKKRKHKKLQDDWKLFPFEFLKKKKFLSLRKKLVEYLHGIFLFQKFAHI